MRPEEPYCRDNGRAIAPIIDRLKATCDTHRPLEARVCEARREIIEHG
jgi:hypothetical protein